jgi:hypothetical protein
LIEVWKFGLNKGGASRTGGYHAVFARNLTTPQVFRGFFSRQLKFAREAAVEMEPRGVSKWGVLKRISIAGSPMPFLSRLLGMFGMLSGLGFAIWLGHYSRWSDVAFNKAAAKAAETAANNDLAERRRLAAEERLKESKRPKPPVDDPWPPVIATKPPFPKAFLAENTFDFGSARVGELKNHFFRIKNVGEAPLVLARPSTCRVASKKWQLQVGESVDYEITWRADEAGRYFAQQVVLFTNDPQRPRIDLKVYGSAVGPLPRVAIDESVFDFGTAQVGQPMRHVFHIRNVGNAPLEFRPAPVCGHAIPPSGAGWRKLLPAGETFDLEMKWTPREVIPNFAIVANFLTNDLEQPEFGVKIRGKIVDPNRRKFDGSDIPIFP